MKRRFEMYQKVKGFKGSYSIIIMYWWYKIFLFRWNPLIPIDTHVIWKKEASDIIISQMEVCAHIYFYISTPESRRTLVYGSFERSLGVQPRYPYIKVLSRPLRSPIEASISPYFKTKKTFCISGSKRGKRLKILL